MNFQRCYELLGMQPGCTWDELQSSYRRLVQKWHPDRYEQHPEQQQIAALRMQEFNEAFSILSEFRRQYGYLPIQMPAETPPPRAETPTEPRPEPQTEHRPQNRVHKPAHDIPDSPAWQTPGPMSAKPRKPKGFNPWILLTALLFGGYYLFAEFIQEGLLPSSGTALPTSTAPADPARTDIPEAGPVAPQKLSKPPAKPKNTFTYGDPPGRVYEIQGVPTRTSGDLWFYGESEVYFDKGKVVSWYNSPTDPLKVLGTPESPPPAPEDKPKPDTP